MSSVAMPLEEIINKKVLPLEFVDSVSTDRVLIVGDNFINRETTARHLTNLGYNVTKASTEDAKHIIKSPTEFSAVIADYKPEVKYSVLDLLNDMRTYPHSLNVPFVVTATPNSRNQLMNSLKSYQHRPHLLGINNGKGFLNEVESLTKIAVNAYQKYKSNPSLNQPYQ